MVLNPIPYTKRRKIAIILFGLALIMAIPPGIPAGEVISDTFLNLPIANLLNTKLGINLMPALILSYTLIPLLIVYLGSIIYPADTTQTFNGQFRKLRNFGIKYINLIKNKPIHLIWLAIGFYIMIRILGFYQTNINVYIL